MIPPICQFWSSLESKLPNLTIGGLNVSVTVASALFLTASRFLAEFMLVRVFGWPSNSLITKNASSSCGSIVHSTQLVPALIACFMTNKYNPSERLKDAPVWWQETASALLQFCTGYMIYDGILNIVWLKSQMQEGGISSEDLMFLGHHIATILYMTSTRIQQVGHQSAMICMLLGELSNPFHNSYLIMEMAQTLDCCNGPLSQAAFHFLNLAFALVYILLRVILAPAIFLHLTINLWLHGPKQGIRWPVVAIYTFLIWAVEIGSIPWITDNYSTLEAHGFPKLTSTARSSLDETKGEL